MSLGRLTDVRGGGLLCLGRKWDWHDQWEHSKALKGCRWQIASPRGPCSYISCKAVTGSCTPSPFLLIVALHASNPLRRGPRPCPSAIQPQPAARVILLVTTVWCWGTPNTTEYNRCTVSLQPLSTENVLQQQKAGPGHESSAGYRNMGIDSLAWFCMVCSFSSSLLGHCCYRYWVRVEVNWAHCNEENNN